MSDTPHPDIPDELPHSRAARWNWRPKVRWFAAEYLIVVLGVLTAVGINAWWAEQQRLAEEQALIAELREDVDETRHHIEKMIGWHKKISHGASAILAGISDGITGTDRDSLLATIGSVLGSSATWQPSDDTYREALGSGRLALITDHEVRSALSHYAVLSDRMGLAADIVATRYLDRDEPFLIENVIYSEVAFDLENMVGQFPDAPHRTDFAALAANPELWNLLSLKFLIANSLADELVAFDSLSVDLLRVLEP